MSVALNAKYNNPDFIGQRFGKLVVKDIKHEEEECLLLRRARWQECRINRSTKE